MARTALAPPELVSHDEFLAQHRARIGSIESVKAEELADAERAVTRAKTAHLAALKVAESEHVADRLSRNAAVVAPIIATFRETWPTFLHTRELGRAQVLGIQWRNQEEVAQRLLGRPLKNELAIAACEHFAAMHPGAINRFAWIENWTEYPMGLFVLANQAAIALRNEFDLRGMQEALLKLESGIGRVGASPGISAVSDQDAPELWKLMADCLPGDIEEQRRQDLIRATKARNASAATAEQSLLYRAVTGEPGARAELARRGAGVLEAAVAGTAGILHRARGHAPTPQEVEAHQAGRHPA